MDPFKSTSGVCKKEFIHLKKQTDLSHPLVFEKRKVAYHTTWTSLRKEGRKIEKLIYLKIWTNQGQPLVVENKNVDIS